jgi:hypothetical protein
LATISRGAGPDHVTSIEQPYDILDHRKSGGEVNVEPERSDEHRVQG